MDPLKLKLEISGEPGQVYAAFRASELVIAKAATAAMTDAANEAKAQARAQIASAGFSKRWQNALRADVYPKGDVSVGAAAHIWHRIPYAGVFEEGGEIAGRPLLWLPLPTAPATVGRQRMTPKRFPGELMLIRRPGKPPLLATPLTVSKSAAKSGVYKRASLAAIRRGGSGKGPQRMVPMFVGVPLVRLRKRLDVAGVVRRAADRLPELYLKNLKVEED